MSTAWPVSIETDSLHLLIAAPIRDREWVLTFLRRIGEEPYMPPDFTERSPNDREYRVKQIHGWTITYWLDQFAKEVRVVRLGRNSIR